MSENPASNVLAIRIAERLKALGMSERKASLEATGQPDAIRFIRTRGTMPSATRLNKIAKVLQATPLYLTGGTNDNDWNGQKNSINLVATIGEEAGQQFESGRIVPVLGTVAMTSRPLESGEITNDIAVYRFTPEVLAFAAAPLGTDIGMLGAFYPADTVMSPVFEPYVPAVFVREVEAGVGEYGLIFFKTQRPDREKPTYGIFALRRIVDRGDGWLTLEQHTPPGKSRVSTDIIERTAKVLSLRDYVAPQLVR